MAKYLLTNDPNYILFDGVVGTPYEGESFAFRKSAIKQIRTEVMNDVINFVHLDDTDSPFRYYDLIDPGTGNPFISLSNCKTTVLLWLNQLVESAAEFLGQWDASTNDPIIADGGYWDGDDIGSPTILADARAYFVVVVAGTTSIDGEAVWEVGDFITSTGSAWVRIPATSTIAASNVIISTVNLTEPEWTGITTVQEAIEVLNDATIRVLSDIPNVSTLITPAEGDALTWNNTLSLWEPRVAGGSRDLTEVISPLDGTDETLPAYGDGRYVLFVGTSASWVPATAAVGDLLTRSGAGFTIETAMAGETAGSLEIKFTQSPYDDANYVWDGTEWDAIDAYETNPALYGLNVSNPIGDITSSDTGADLRFKSLSKIIDDMLFETIYNPPSSPTLSLTGGGNYERGFDITGTLTPNFTQNGGGAVLTYDIDAIYNSTVQATESGSGPTIPNADLDDINLYDLKMNPTTNQLSQVEYTVEYDDGPIPTDNKGQTYPGDQILTGSISTTRTYTARYPIWYETTANAYGVSGGDLTDLSVAPTLTGTDIKALGDKELFTSNLSNKTDTIHSGDVTILVALPPGITMSDSEINVAGSWLDFSDLRDNSVTVGVTAADGTTSKNYTVYYARSVAASSFTVQQDYRFTTTGTVTP